jgi:hypothetical protein
MPLRSWRERVARCGSTSCHHDDVAWAKFGSESLRDIGLEGSLVDWAAEHKRAARPPIRSPATNVVIRQCPS